jgi:hypothetical protein
MDLIVEGFLPFELLNIDTCFKFYFPPWMGEVWKGYLEGFGI